VRVRTHEVLVIAAARSHRSDINAEWAYALGA
jgi:hypothetical protein